MMILVIFATIALLIIALQTILNVFILPRLKSPSIHTIQPFVSILIPARNEASIIQHTLENLSRQTYQNFEVIVLDDVSIDSTGDIARKFATQDSRLRVINGSPLPLGWMGKNWACYNLAQQAKGEILLFTDADTVWKPDALNALIAQMQKHNTDLLTIWSTQETVTWSERLVVPLMAFVILGYLPIIMTHYSPFAIFAAANGQCMAWKRQAYQRVNGHQAVANNVLEDVTLARLAKSHGLKLRMADGNGLIGCRMYTDWTSVRNGYAKNILAGYGNSLIALLIATLFHIILFIMPFALLLSPNFMAWGLSLIVLGILTRALTASFSQQRPQDALFMPISVLLMTGIAFQAIYWHYTGGVRWKGRTIPQTKDNLWANQPSSSVQGSAD